MKNLSKKTQYLILLAAVLVTLGAAYLIYLQTPSQKAKAASEKAFKNCISEFKKDSFDSVMISMFDIPYTSENFEHFLAQNTYVFDESIKYSSEVSKIPSVVDALAKNENTEKYVYLCIDPITLSEFAGDRKKIRSYISKNIGDPVFEHPEITFEFCFPYYNIAHYVSLSDEEISSFCVAASAFSNVVSDYPNALIDFPSDEPWLLENEYIFEEGSGCIPKADEIERVFANIFVDRNYAESADNIPAVTNNFISYLSSYSVEKNEYPDLSGKNIVILGDSIFAIAKDDTSIHSAFTNYSGADVICKAIGGSPASVVEGSGLGIFGGELNDLDSLKTEISGIVGNGEETIFIIEFGLNDYFIGAKTENPDDKYDPSTYCGALRTGIEKLQKEYPGSPIIMMAPGYITVFDGEATSFTGEGPVLTDYRNSCRSVCEEYDLLLFDIESETGITAETEGVILADGVHYNENGRLIIGKALLRFIDENT